MIGFIKKSLFIITAILIFIMTGCSGGNKVQSSLAENMIIDGIQNEWGGYLQYYEDDLVSVGFKNDNENLYLCLVTQDQSLKRTIMSSGLIVWFEPEKGEKFGLKFPIREEFGHPSGQGMSGGAPDMSQKNEGEPGGGIGNHQGNMQDKLNEFFEKQIKFSIIDEDEYPLYQLQSDTNNIEVKAKINNYALVYEAKMPLYTDKAAEYFVASSPGEEIKISLETPEMEMPEGGPGGDMSGSGGGMGGPGGGGPGGGMGGGPGGGMGGPGGGMGSPGGMGQSESSGLEMSFKVLLVTTP